MYPGIFLDRDGVIIQNRANYVRSWADVAFIPGSLAALARLKDSPYRILIITNQSAIGRGLLLPQTADEINEKMIGEINKAGGRVDGIFICPHQPEDNCACRKPRPGLILQAVQAWQIDLAKSILIGDNLSDLQAGQAAGVARLALVRTGLGAQQLTLPLPADLKSFDIYTDLFEALQNYWP
jgi:D-glycero-D-manno-heptose 1,7-bisphosphate phosphatase